MLDLVVFTAADSTQCAHILPLFKPQRPANVRLTTHLPHYNLRLVVSDDAACKRLQTLYPTAEVVVADLRNAEEAAHILQSATTCYHVGERDEKVSFNVIDAAVAESKRPGNSFEHFAYSSVLHPQLRQLPGHAAKLAVEEYLLQSGLDFTIFQPAAILEDVSVDKWYKDMSFVAADDLAEAVANVLQNSTPHIGATYELVSIPKASYGDEAGEPVAASTPIARGSSSVLSYLLGRAPTTLEQWKN